MFFKQEKLHEKKFFFLMNFFPKFLFINAYLIFFANDL